MSTATLSTDDRLSLTEAAARARVSANTISAWVHAGKLQGVRVGRRLLVDAADLQRFLEGEPIKAGNSHEEVKA